MAVKEESEINPHLLSLPPRLIYSFVTVNGGFLIVLGRPRLESALRPEMVYYHPLKSCTNFADVDTGSHVVSKDIHRLLSGVHLRHLRKEFGLELD